MAERTSGNFIDVAQAEDERDPARLLVNARKINRTLELAILGAMGDELFHADEDWPILQELAWSTGMYLHALGKVLAKDTAAAVVPTPPTPLHAVRRDEGAS